MMLVYLPANKLRPTIGQRSVRILAILCAVERLCSTMTTFLSAPIDTESAIRGTSSRCCRSPIVPAIRQLSIGVPHADE